MRSATIPTNQTCNQKCAFCSARRASENPAIAAPDRIRAKVDAFAAKGVAEIALTGGEPTLRRDLPAYVRYAKRRGIPSVGLETNGTLLTGERTAKLAAAGLDHVRVHVPAWGSECDAITQDPGGWAATWSGIQAVIQAGLRLEVAVPVVRANADQVALIPERIRRANVAVSRLVVAIPYEAPSSDSLLPLARATSVVEALVSAAAKEGLEVGLAPDTFIPPCAFPKPDRVAHMYSMTRGGAVAAPGFHKQEGCQHCTVTDRCRGVPETLRADGFTVKPITQDRTRRRLSTISGTREQVERELVTEEIYRGPMGELWHGATVRINFRCNQACKFCFVSTHLPSAPESAVRAAIEQAGRKQAVIGISGGEPTLNPKLVEYVRLARDSGARKIELQTNATRLDDPELVERLIEAGLDEVFVSLHGITAEVSDRVTEAPGTFEKTVRGIDRVARTHLRLTLNFVFCQANYHQFPQYITTVADRWPGALVTVSFVAPSTDLVPNTKELIPSYTEVLPYLVKGVQKIEEHQLRAKGFDSMCGLPLCLVQGLPIDYSGLADIPDGFDGGEFLKTEACRRCARERQCFGIRRRYYELYGGDELRPVPLDSLPTA